MAKSLSGCWFDWKIGIACTLACAGCSGAGDPGALGESGEPVAQTAESVVYGGHDYLFYVSPLSRSAAKAICEMNGYRLVTIDNAAEQTFLHGEELQRGGDRWWIGYSDQVSEGTWVWDSGTPNGYVNWALGEPNDGAGGLFGEDCAVDSWNTFGQWGDVSCLGTAKFICERGTIPAGNYAAFSYSATNTNSAQQNTAAYAIDIKANKSVTVGTCGLNGGVASGDTYLRLYNPSGVQVAFDDDACGGRSSNFSYAAPVTGTYTLRAGCYAAQSCSGTVAIVGCLAAACNLF